jgi:hypothetical protein
MGANSSRDSHKVLCSTRTDVSSNTHPTEKRMIGIHKHRTMCLRNFYYDTRLHFSQNMHVSERQSIYSASLPLIAKFPMNEQWILLSTREIHVIHSFLKYILLFISHSSYLKMSKSMKHVYSLSLSNNGKFISHSFVTCSSIIVLLTKCLTSNVSMSFCQRPQC